MTVVIPALRTWMRAFAIASRSVACMRVGRCTVKRLCDSLCREGAVQAIAGDGQR